MRAKSKSEAFKYGEPDDHKKAVQKLVKFWQQNSEHPCSYDYYIQFTEAFIKKQKLRKSNRTEMGHEYDFIAFTNNVIDDNQIFTEYGFIEVDGEKHDKKNQKINDGVAEDFIHDLYPKAFFIRLKKHRLLEDDAKVYMTEQLKHVL